MARNVVFGLDVGTSMVHAMIAEYPRGSDPRILGIGITPASGLRRGVVVDLEEARDSIKSAIDEAAKEAGMLPKRAYVGVGGPHIMLSASRGVVAVSRADGEISEDDIQRVIQAAESFLPKNPNRELLHVIPREFRVDADAGIKDPLGMAGVRLEVDAITIESSASSLKNLTKCIEAAGIHVAEFVFSPLATLEAVLSKRQRELGAIVIDIGGQTTNFAVVEERRLIHAGSFSYGASHITNDIAILLRTSLDAAEAIKVKYGHAIPDQFTKKEMIKLSEFIPGHQGAVLRREIAEITEARFSDIFELVRKELKKINREELLPAGAILIGGGAKIEGVMELAKKELRLPVEIGEPRNFRSYLHARDFPVLATAVGLLQWGELREAGEMSLMVGETGREMPSWIKKLYSLLFP